MTPIIVSSHSNWIIFAHFLSPKPPCKVDASREVPSTDPSSDPEEAFRSALEKQLLAGSKAIIMHLSRMQEKVYILGIKMYYIKV